MNSDIPSRSLGLHGETGIVRPAQKKARLFFESPIATMRLIWHTGSSIINKNIATHTSAGDRIALQFDDPSRKSELSDFFDAAARYVDSVNRLKQLVDKIILFLI